MIIILGLVSGRWKALFTDDEIDFLVDFLLDFGIGTDEEDGPSQGGRRRFTAGNEQVRDDHHQLRFCQSVPEIFKFHFLKRIFQDFLMFF